MIAACHLFALATIASSVVAQAIPLGHAEAPAEVAAEPAQRQSGPLGDGVDAGIDLPGATRFRLVNGLDVVLQENHRQPQVALLVSYDVGSRDDPPGFGGLAHLVEHMTYRGSRHLAPYQAMGVIESAGGISQGKTALDRTSYETVLPREALSVGLWVESERMAFTLESFNATALDSEKRVVASELRVRGGPTMTLERGMTQAMFGSHHPYLNSFAADSDLPAIQLSDVQGHFQQSYRPDNAHLILVGDFQPDAARTLIEQYFSPLVNPRRPLRRAPLDHRAEFASHVVTLTVPNLTRRTLIMAWPAPSPATRDAATLRMFAAVFATKLTRTLVRDAGLATHISTQFETLDAGGAFRVEIVLARDADESQVETEIHDAWTRTWSSDWSSVLEETKHRVEVSMLQLLESPLQQAQAHLWSLSTWGRPFDWNHEVWRYRSTTLADLVALEGYFRDHRWLVARLVRANGQDSVSSSGRLTISN